VLRARRQAEGDVFSVRLVFAGPVAMVADPQAVEALAGSDPSFARAGEGRRAVLPMASPASVFGADGEAHATARRRLSPAFSPEGLAGRRDAIAAIAERHAAGWPVGRPFLLLSRVRALVDEVFVRVMLGIGDERAAEAAASLGRMLRTPANPPLPPPGEGDGVWGSLGEAIFARRRAPFEKLLREELESRPEDGGGGEDLIDLLLRARPRLGVEQIVEELITMAMAAQEPPSIALTWLLERLGRSPALAAEYLSAGEDEPLREAVLRESLRLRPSALASVRKLEAPFEAGGRTLPAGTSAAVPIPLVQRDPRFFPRPDSFDPGRWLDGETGGPAFLPFGGGSRRCIGEALARSEVAAIVPVVLGSLRLRPLWPRRERMVLRATVLVPHRSVPVVASR
jgi:cytochrome P450